MEIVEGDMTVGFHTESVDLLCGLEPELTIFPNHCGRNVGRVLVGQTELMVRQLCHRGDAACPTGELEALGLGAVICLGIPASASAEYHIIHKGNILKGEVHCACSFVDCRDLSDTINGIDAPIPIQSQIFDGNGLGFVDSNISRAVIHGGPCGKDQGGAIAFQQKIFHT